MGRSVRDRCPKAVDQFDRVQPEPAHLARHVTTHIGKLPVLGSDQIGPVARGDIGLVFVPSMVADACHDGCGVVGLRPRELSVRESEREREKDGTNQAIHVVPITERGSVAGRGVSASQGPVAIQFSKTARPRDLIGPRQRDPSARRAISLG